MLKWKFLLPVFQSALAIALWLYAPVQYRKELLDWSHLPSDHPFRFHFEGYRRFPPVCEQAIYVISFPAYTVYLAIDNRVLYPIEMRRQAGLPEWTFTVPIKDPQALPPRESFYAVHTGEMIFLALIILFWWRAGCWVDAHFQKAGATYPRWRRALCVVDLAILGAVLLCSIIYTYILIVRIGSPPFRHVALFGLIWDALLLAYISSAVRKGVTPRQLKLAGAPGEPGEPA
jgi:hypothetical protein